jgi:hypothetical protein
MGNIFTRVKQADVTVDVGALTVDITPPNDVVLTNDNGTTTGDFTIPAGKVKVVIENRGGDAFANITVNGDTVAPGGKVEREVIFDGVNRYLLPAFVVVTNGSLVFWSYDTP